MKASHHLAVTAHHSHRLSLTPGGEDMKFSLDADVNGMIEDEPDPRARQLLQESVGLMYKTGDSAEIEVKHLLKYLKSRQQQSLLCQRLPFTVLIFAVFTNMVLWHEDLSAAGLMQRNLRSMISGTTFEGVQYTSGHKDFYDILETKDIYTFLREALLPLFLREDPEEVLRTEGAKELHRALRYNRLIGGVQVQQMRWQKEPCSGIYDGHESTKAIVSGVTCFKQPGADDCFGPLKFGVRLPGARAAMPSGFCGDKSSEGYGQLFYAPAPAAGAGSSPSNSSGRRLGFPHLGPGGEGAPPSPSPPARRPPSKRRRGRRGASGGAGAGRGVGAGAGGAAERRLRMSAGRKAARAVTRNSPTINPGIDIMQSDTYSVLFTEEAGLPGALEKLKWLEENRWIDLQTEWVGVNILLLNPELSMYSHSTVSIYFGASGEVLPFLEVQTFHAEPYQSIAIIAIDIAFLLIILYAQVDSWGHLLLAVHRRKVWHHLQVPWNWARMAMANGGLLVIVLWAVGYDRLFAVKALAMEVDAWLSKAIASRQTQQPAAQQLPQELLQNASFANSSMAAGMSLKGIGDDPEYVGLLLEMHREVFNFAAYVVFYRRVLAAYGILLLAGFLRLFQMQPRLAMLTNTLLQSWKDVVHHMAVFVMLWMAFAASGMLIFGRTLFAFGGFFTAITKTFTIMLGDLDWDELSAENPELAAAWLWVFLSLMTQLMMNMLMAIIMDVYGEVKNKALEGDPIWVQLYAMVVDWMQDRDEIGPRALERILKRIETRQEVQKLSARLLAHIVPGMSQEQSVELVAGALHLHDVTSGTTMTLSQMQQLIGRIHLDTEPLVGKTEGIVTHMREEIEVNREMAERRRAELESRSAEMSRLQAEERWEHSRRFQRRARAMEEKLERGERLMKDYLTWLRFRGRQVDEQVTKIEGLTRARAQAPEQEPPLPPPKAPGAAGSAASSGPSGIGALLAGAGALGSHIARVLQDPQAGPAASPRGLKLPDEGKEPEIESPQKQRMASEWFHWDWGQAAEPSTSSGADVRTADGSPLSELPPWPETPTPLGAPPAAAAPAAQERRAAPSAQAPQPSGALKVPEVLRPSEREPAPQAVRPSKALPPRQRTPLSDATSPTFAAKAPSQAASSGSPAVAPPPAAATPLPAAPSAPAAPPPPPLPPSPHAGTPEEAAAAAAGATSPAPPASLDRVDDSAPSRPAAPSGQEDAEPPVPRGLRGVNLEIDEDMPLPRLAPLRGSQGGADAPARRTWLSAELEDAEEELLRPRGRSSTVSNSGEERVQEQSKASAWRSAVAEDDPTASQTSKTFMI